MHIELGLAVHCRLLVHLIRLYQKRMQNSPPHPPSSCTTPSTEPGRLHSSTWREPPPEHKCSWTEGSDERKKVRECQTISLTKEETNETNKLTKLTKRRNERTGHWSWFQACCPWSYRIARSFLCVQNHGGEGGGGGEKIKEKCSRN